MARAGEFIIHTSAPGDKGEYCFYTVATSRSNAERTFRKQHPRWRIKAVTEPSFLRGKKASADG